jgi:hypothetical protein
MLLRPCRLLRFYIRGDIGPDRIVIDGDAEYRFYKVRLHRFIILLGRQWAGAVTGCADAAQGQRQATNLLSQRELLCLDHAGLDQDVIAGRRRTFAETGPTRLGATLVAFAGGSVFVFFGGCILCAIREGRTRGAHLAHRSRGRGGAGCVNPALLRFCGGNGGPGRASRQVLKVEHDVKILILNGIQVQVL